MTIRGFKIRPVPSTDLRLYVNCDKKILQNTLSMSKQGKLKHKEASKETHNKL